MRIYSVRLLNQSVSGAITLIQIKAGSACSLRLMRAGCGQRASTSSAMQPIEIVRKSAAATVTSFTPLLWAPNDAAAQAAGGTSATGVNASAEGTDGDVLFCDNWNILNSWIWVPTPEERIEVPAAGIIGLKFPLAPGAALTVDAYMVFQEIG